LYTQFSGIIFPRYPKSYVPIDSPAVPTDPRMGGKANLSGYPPIFPTNNSSKEAIDQKISSLYQIMSNRFYPHDIPNNNNSNES